MACARSSYRPGNLVLILLIAVVTALLVVQSRTVGSMHVTTTVPKFTSLAPIATMRMSMAAPFSPLVLFWKFATRSTCASSVTAVVFGSIVVCGPIRPAVIEASEQEKSWNSVETLLRLLMRLEAKRRPLLTERWQGALDQPALMPLNEFGLPSPEATGSPMETMTRFWSAAAGRVTAEGREWCLQQCVCAWKSSFHLLSVSFVLAAHR